ncbi:MAG TPA: Fpg/Nei family DNA glycosylase [Tepidisphaeraceae bacterium]|jgi:formamidopyrimidine-DNA glycosylase|nr:Fpg/Nei family DNA glycosylase [Tepidisphaeraceae bacterium]
MPELPEVETVVTTLRPRLIGRRIASVRLARQDILMPTDIDLSALLTGRSVEQIERRGKRIVLTLDDGNRFYIHLGMTGQLTVAEPTAEAPPHTHLVVDLGPDSSGRADAVRKERREKGGDCKLQIEETAAAASHAPAGPPAPTAPQFEISNLQFAICNPILQLRFRDPRRFGGIWWLGRGDCDAGMGPEPLTVRPGELAKRLARTTRAIKSALLDQSVVAGLGNIYVDESLFLAGIHPLIPADKLTEAQIARLNRAIKSTLRKAIKNRGSTLRDYRDADGAIGDYQSKHKVYGREKEPCRTCRTPIERVVLGGRSTHFCPKCQRR